MRKTMMFIFVAMVMMLVATPVFAQGGESAGSAFKF